jgi:hypothetical protein
MPARKLIRYLLVPLALIGLLVMATTLGNVWHRHNSNSEHACSICHLNHQPFERPVAGHRQPVFALIYPSSEITEPAPVADPEFHRIPARAPPAV